MPTTVARKTTPAAVTSSQISVKPSTVVADTAKALGLGKLKSTESSMGGRVIFNYEKGSLKVQSGKIQSLNVADRNVGSEIDIPKSVLDSAIKNKLGAYQGSDWAMGGRISYNFKKGSVNTQNGAVKNVAINAGPAWTPAIAHTPSAAVTAGAVALGLGKLKRTDPLPTGEVIFTYEKGGLKTKGGKIEALLAEDSNVGGELEIGKAVVDEAIKGKLGAFTDTEWAMGGRIMYNFKNGSVLTQQGAVQGIARP